MSCSIEQVQLKEEKYRKFANQPYLIAAEIILLSMNIDPDLVPRDVDSYYFKQFGFIDQSQIFDEKLEMLNRLQHKKLLNLNDPPSLASYISLLQQFGWEFPEGLIDFVKERETTLLLPNSSKMNLRTDVEHNFNLILLAVTEYFYSLPEKAYKHGSRPNSGKIGKKLNSIMRNELKISDPPSIKTISDYLRNSQYLRTSKKASETV